MSKDNISKLLDIMAQLRNPDGGCPWDLEQTFASIAPYTIEEAYEVADAIERGDLDDLRDELGDLLLQVVYHAQMAAEQEAFNFAAVVDGISAKMVRRHPHVFADERVDDAAQQTDAWEREKRRERAARRQGGALDGVAHAMPALMRARKLGKRAAAVGFDWPDSSGVRAKIHEELGELSCAEQGGNSAEVHEEIGDLLFTVANLARHLGVDPEQALRAANAKFSRRFKHMEAELEKRGSAWDTLSPDAMERLWQLTKLAMQKDETE